MAIGGEVLEMLCAGKVWTIYGDDYDSIIWGDGIALLTEAEFKAGFAKYDAWYAEQLKKQQEQKIAAEAKLAALGLDKDDLKALGLG